MIDIYRENNYYVYLVMIDIVCLKLDYYYSLKCIHHPNALISPKYISDIIFRLSNALHEAIIRSGRTRKMVSEWFNKPREEWRVVIKVIESPAWAKWITLAAVLQEIAWQNCFYRRPSAETTTFIQL